MKEKEEKQIPPIRLTLQEYEELLETPLYELSKQLKIDISITAYIKRALRIALENDKK